MDLPSKTYAGFYNDGRVDFREVCVGEGGGCCVHVCVYVCVLCGCECVSAGAW